MFSFVLFFLCCPAAFVCSAHFGRASCFLAFSSGCHSGPRAFLGFSLNLRGLSSLAPSEALFLGTRGGRGVSWLLFLGLCFPLLFCSAASHVFLEGPANGSTYGRPGALDVPPLARVRARGSPSEGGGLVPSCFGIWLPYFVGRGSQGPRAFVSGMGAFLCPHTGPFFHTHLFSVSRPRFFFFKRERWPSGPRVDCQPLPEPLPNSERCSENTQKLPEKSRLSTPSPPLLLFWVVLGGNAVRFFPAWCFGKSP